MAEPFMNSYGAQSEATKEADKTAPIAIIGMGCRLPGDATDPEKLYEMCVNGRDAWSTFPQDRFNVDGSFHPDPSRKGSVWCPSLVVYGHQNDLTIEQINVKGGYFIREHLSKFDANFFNLSRAEVAVSSNNHKGENITDVGI